MSKKGEIATGFQCRGCGGELRITETGSTDASRWEEHECVECKRSGEVYNSVSAGTPEYRGVTERKRNLGAD